MDADDLFGGGLSESSSDSETEEHEVFVVFIILLFPFNHREHNRYFITA